MTGILSYFQMEVTVGRPAVRKSRGSDAYDYRNVTEHVEGGCWCEPVTEGREMEGRAANQSSQARLLTPVDADIQLRDVVTALGERWLVTEAKPHWPSPTGRLAHREFALERWEG